jgi:hypothetical protein
MLLIHKTFEVVTPESAEDGEAADSGFDQKNEPYTFRELVSAMKVHYQPSCWPLRGTEPADHVWFTSGSDTDYVTGAETTTSIHFSRANNPRSAKYWLKAAKYAGIIR